MGLFKSLRTETVLQEHWISDNGYNVMVDAGYAEMGQTEGWLKFVHGYRDYRGVYVSTYHHIRETEDGI